MPAGGGFALVDRDPCVDTWWLTKYRYTNSGAEQQYRNGTLYEYGTLANVHQVSFELDHTGVWSDWHGAFHMYAGGVMCTIRFTFAGDNKYWVSLTRTGHNPDTYHGRDSQGKEVVMVFEEKWRWDLEREEWVSIADQ